MASNTKKRKYMYFPRRQKSLDCGITNELDGVNGKRLMLHRLKSIDEKDSTDFDQAGWSGVHIGLSDQIKLAAIYNNEPEISRILSSNMTENDVQRILAKNDERGQPCIFYALESRSHKALVCLLNYAGTTDCVIAANGESVIHVATKMGDIDILRRLFEYDFVVELVDHVDKENGRAPLHLAAKFNHVEIAMELLQHGAKIDREDVTGKSPLYIAASDGHADLLKVFFEQEKDRVEDLLFDTSYGRSIYKNILHVAVASGDENSAQVCLDQNPEIVRRYLQWEIKHGDGYLIHAVCKNGMEKCLMRFVELMGRFDMVQLSRKDKLGFAPIHKAAMNNHVNLVRFIGSKSKRFVNETTEYSQTALVLAAQHGHIKVVEELLELKADFRISDDSDRTVLHYAIEHPEILKLLLKKNDLAKMLINAKEKDGYTPVHNAALRGFIESVQILLDYGAELNVFTNTSRSPLHCAVSSQRSDVVELVLASEPALINKADATGKTPLHTAASYGSAKVVKRLLDNGALIVRDGNLFSPLHIAASKGHLSIVEMLLAFDKNSIDWVNKYRRTALLTAASSCKTDVVKFLLDKNAAITEDYDFLNCLDWSLVKNDKQSAMMMMCHDRWKEIMMTAKNGTEGTMYKLVCSMPDVAHQALSNSMMSVGHPDTKEHWVRYNFMCLQDPSSKGKNLKPLAAIKAMIRMNCYSCLCHPVCCKYLKEKWMNFGWKIYSASLLIYLVFLVSLNVYAFGIPSYQKSKEDEGDRDVSINVKLAMIVCIVFASLNSFKEIVQLMVYKFNYFLDKVNYLECILFISTFIFAVPMDGKIAVKNSSQWKACSLALFCAWLNLVMYLRRFASYGIIVLMMRRISATLIKVMVLLIFFLVAFAAAFTVIMNDREGFKTFGVTMLTTATMTMGEFDFKETFLKDVHEDYSSFYWLRVFHLVVFLVVMPIIIMNLLLALAIDDTNSIMQRAKLQKHIQTAKMIIDLERKRSRFSWRAKRRLLPTLEERPNKAHDFSRTIWEFIFYGPDFSSDQNVRSTVNSTEKETLGTILDVMKELQRQNAILQNKVMEIQNEFTLERNRRSREYIKLSQDKQNACTQFRGYSQSIEGSLPPEPTSAKDKRKVWGGLRWNNDLDTGVQSSSVLDQSDIEMDVFDDKEREEKEKDPELEELKRLHSHIEKEDCEESEDGIVRNGKEEIEKNEVGISDETETLSDEGRVRRDSELLDDYNNVIVV